MRDQLDRMVEEWRRERPDLDPTAMATVGRILRAAAFIGEQLDWFAAEHGLTRPEGDVLITIRRTGSPYRVSYRSLVKLMMLTPEKVNRRVEQLEQRGLVNRVTAEDESRYVELTT